MIHQLQSLLNHQQILILKDKVDEFVEAWRGGLTVLEIAVHVVDEFLHYGEAAGGHTA